MRHLSIDIETYSDINLLTSGVYKYVDSPNFEILLFAYANDDEPVQLIDLTEERLPQELIDDLQDPDVTKTAFNANFEITCLSKYLNLTLDPSQWRCTSVHALALGLPNALGAVSMVLKLEEQKMGAGKLLIQYFSKPCKPTKSNGGRTRNLPHHDLARWKLFKDYCIRDVEVERNIKNRISFYTITDKEQKLWQLDQSINRRGVKIDTELVEQAIIIDEEYTEKLATELKKLTGVENVNSVTQLKEALGFKSLTKEAVSDLIKTSKDPNLVRILKLRQMLSKTSIKKYEAMRRCICSDGRVRGLFQFYGANRTGRWAGRLVQVQNLPQNHLSDLDSARTLVRDGLAEDVEVLYGNVSDTLSQLIRTAFIASEGNRFIVADYSAIEARVIAWLSGETWRQDVFKSHGKIYEASASQMFKVPIESIKKGSMLRQKGKVSELALGYQGGVGALKQMGALKMGVPEEELQGLVDSWRKANPHIVKLWYDVERAVKHCIENKEVVKFKHNIKFIPFKGCLFIELPSGRRLSYVKARIEEDLRGRKKIVYEGMNQTTKNWEKLETYGGKLVENITQAIARDCLGEAMLKLDEAGYEIVMHVHDEVIIDAPMSQKLEDVCDIMGQPIDWAPGLLLRADGYETYYYMKD